MTSRWLLVWDGTRITTVATFPGDRPYAALFPVGSESYLWTRDGISRLHGTRLVPVPGGEAFRGRRVDQVEQRAQDTVIAFFGVQRPDDAGDEDGGGDGERERVGANGHGRLLG
jgi:hypothetical protein